MTPIPTSITEEDFNGYILPHLTTARRGYVSKYPLINIFNAITYKLYTGCQWQSLAKTTILSINQETQISWQTVYHHFQKWSKSGNFKDLWQKSIARITGKLDTSCINLDGSHCQCKKGGEEVAYQARKKAKTTNIIPIVDRHGYIIEMTSIISGNHHDAFHLKTHLQSAFKSLRKMGLLIKDTYFNADRAFDTREARKVCFNYGLIPNIDQNMRNQKGTKLGRKRMFNKDVYKNRFAIERSFAWIDKFRSLLIRFERKIEHFLALHHLAFTLINLRTVIQEKV